MIFPPHLPSLAELSRTLVREKITTLWLTAGLFHQMVDHEIDGLRRLRQLLAGGDVLSVSHVQKVLRELPGCAMINGYGPTENTTFTCCHRVASAEEIATSVPIGRPIANTHVYILDRYDQLAPVGVPGELVIGGDGLAHGLPQPPRPDGGALCARSLQWKGGGPAVPDGGPWRATALTGPSSFWAGAISR
ncbi:MAG: hypothetical protein KatS3mg057_2227 [Herpetosiphonaceae bacterium]|nr:MAG: hypothetical protein KatS3mg057_2227 [Herpetosiphonaceae bacterium]